MNLSKLKNLNKFTSKGFTLIELLIVIAILGVLAAGILVAIDPVEQLDRAADAGRKSSISQLGRAVQAYYTSKQYYPLANTTWMTTMQTSGEIKVIPADSSTITTPCTTLTEHIIDAQNKFCYKADNHTGPAETGVTMAKKVIVYTAMKSKSEKSKCATNVGVYFVYATEAGRAGIFCAADATGEPTTDITDANLK